MALIVSILSILTLGTGVFGLASPAAMSRFVERFGSSRGLWTAVVLRLVFGAALWRVAPASRAPVTLQVLGALFVASAFALPLIGLPRFQALVSWWTGQSATVVRVWSAVTVALATFLLWSVH
jgi:hypothetical protein